MLWFVTSRALQFSVKVSGNSHNLVSLSVTSDSDTPIQVGERAFVYQLDLPFASSLVDGDRISYQLDIDEDGHQRSFTELMPDLLYDGESAPTVVFKSQRDSILHGSCRKPHYPNTDGLVEADKRIAAMSVQERPALLMMSGDQIYADDVAGPMLAAVHSTMALLGLWPEKLAGAQVTDTASLLASELCYYAREQLLPEDRAGDAVEERFFAGARKPIFTSDAAHNHLITLSEVIAMYLLVWSPVLWRHINAELSDVPEEHFERYQREQKAIHGFVEGLPRVQRLLAHIPTYMMFDDHDVTDDWNLTRGWEETAYGHPLSRRIIGNALAGYWLCQGWGNAPERFAGSCEQLMREFFKQHDDTHHQKMVDYLLGFDCWHYTVPGSPKLVVLDTRTHRWRSESRANQPSGLMDWEALSELQNELIGEEAVILISPAPIFGVKLIETIQRIFTYFNRALMVDAENWMAHPGSANVILNIFQHPKTPRNFVILSGDVHYSFAYDVSLRMRKQSPHIWQITCSGFKNEFPQRLLATFDKLNTALFGSKSPLNVFTKRRRMRIKARKLSNGSERRLFNASGVGYLRLSKEGQPEQISVWCSNGDSVDFVKDD